MTFGRKSVVLDAAARGSLKEIIAELKALEQIAEGLSELEAML